MYLINPLFLFLGKMHENNWKFSFNNDHEKEQYRCALNLVKKNASECFYNFESIRCYVYSQYLKPFSLQIYVLKKGVNALQTGSNFIPYDKCCASCPFYLQYNGQNVCDYNLNSMKILFHIIKLRKIIVIGLYFQ